jgi:hypothetical protein
MYPVTAPSSRRTSRLSSMCKRAITRLRTSPSSNHLHLRVRIKYTTNYWAFPAIPWNGESAILSFLTLHNTTQKMNGSAVVHKAVHKIISDILRSLLSLLKDRNTETEISGNLPYLISVKSVERSI